MKCEYCGGQIVSLPPEWIDDGPGEDTETFHTIEECEECGLKNYNPRATRKKRQSERETASRCPDAVSSFS